MKLTVLRRIAAMAAAVAVLAVFVFLGFKAKASDLNLPYDITFSPGTNASEIRFNWISRVNKKAEVEIAKTEDVKSGKFPAGSAFYGTTEAALASPGSKNGSGVTKRPTGEYASKAVVSNLLPSTEYTYRVGDGENFSINYTFKTGAPKKGFSFAAFGDPQIGANGNGNASYADSLNGGLGWADTLSKVTSKYPSVNFLLSLGDQINEYDSLAIEQKQYVSFFNPDSHRSVIQNYPLAAVEGNHDHAMGKYFSFHYNQPNLSALGATENKNVKNCDGDYWFSYGNTLFLILNGNDAYDISSHDGFLKQAVKANPNSKWKIAAWHQSAYSAAGGTDDSVMFIRQNWTKLMDKYGIDVVLQGHDHCYTRSFQMYSGSPVDTKQTKSVTNPSGTAYFTLDSGSGSKYYQYAESAKLPFKAVSWQQNVPTYSYVTIDDTHFKISTFRTDTGASIDDYTILKTSKRNKFQNINFTLFSAGAAVIALIFSAAGLIKHFHKRMRKIG